MAALARGRRRSGKLPIVLQRLSSPQKHTATAANALSPAADARILGSAAMDAIGAGSDQAGALTLN
jgi:hypothetical protein